MFSAYDSLAKQVFPPKNGPVPSQPVTAYRSYSFTPASGSNSPPAIFSV